MTATELGRYFLAWQESVAEVARLRAVGATPAAVARAEANAHYDRALYIRLRRQQQNGE